MNPRELLMAALDGRPVSRVPVWLLFPYHRLSCYVDVTTHPLYREVFDAVPEYGVTLDRRSLGTRLFADEVSDAREQIDGVKTRVIRYGDTSIVEGAGQSGCASSLRRLLKTDEDLEAFCSLPLQTDPRRIEAELDACMGVYMAERSEFPSHLGSMMLCLGEPIAPLYHLSHLDSYAIWSLTHADLISAWLERAMERTREIYRCCLERDLADVYFLVGSELASPPLVSRETFRSWIVPYAREIVDMIRSYGKKSIVHYHGQIKTILPDFVEIGPDALHTIEAPPVGDCTFTEAYKIVGDRMTLIGNIQYDCFRSYTTSQMRAAVHDVCDECNGRRFILSPSAGPYDPDIPRTVTDNYMAFLRAADEWSRANITGALA